MATSIRPHLALGCILALSGCAAPIGGGSGGDCDLPGDVDCSPTAGGKGDAWDSRNDPQRVSQNLNYRIAELPRDDQFTGEAWAASYWPTLEGSTNYRWQGPSTLSPLEKYDAAIHGWTPSADYASAVPRDCGPDAKVSYGAYRDSLGPAARWQSGAQGRDQMFDGVDNDDDGEIDECGYDDHDGIESWWGLCHAWAPAAILEPEPLHAVDYNGQRFEVSDIKALILTVYDGTESLFLGGRCNAKEFDRDENHRITNEECRDVNAGAWHVVVTNFLGLNGRAFVEDRTAGFQVWNQPLIGYQVTQQDEISRERAVELLGLSGADYIYNDRAERFFEVKMTTDYLTEGSQSTEPLGSDGYIRHDHYHYILEVDGAGKIIGGEWLGSSRDNHPDFLWVPLRALASSGSSWSNRANPHVDFDTVRMLLRLSRETDQPDAPVGGTTFENATEQAIPDNDANGVTSVIDVSDSIPFQSVSVTVDVTHSYRGDLRVELEHAGVRVTLHDRQGGSADNLRETYTVGDFAGTPSQGPWTLRVVDTAAADEGTLRRFTVTLVGGN